MTKPYEPLLVTLPGQAEPIDVYSDEGFAQLSRVWTKAGWQRKLSYEVTWLGVPIIQLPEDMVMMQELLYKVRPGSIIETGVAHGGSLVLYASILQLLGRGKVIGVDVEIRKYNRLAIQSHPLSPLITLIEGSSTDPEVVAAVQRNLVNNEPVIVALDSNHTREHVLRELELYSPLVGSTGYVVVFDTIMDDVADTPNGQEDWAATGAGAAVRQFLRDHPEFEADPYYERLAATYCHGGFLRRRAPDQDR